MLPLERTYRVDMALFEGKKQKNMEDCSLVLVVDSLERISNKMTSNVAGSPTTPTKQSNPILCTVL